MYKVDYTSAFEKQLKKCIKRGWPIEEFKTVAEILALEGRLPREYKPHKLSGKYKGLWECHIKPDWLLIWRQDDDKLVLLFMHIGTHSDLF